MLLGWQPFWGALVQLNPTYQALPLGNIPFTVNVTWNMTDQQIASSGNMGVEINPVMLADTNRVNISSVMMRSGFNEYRSTVNFTTLSSTEDSGTYTCIVTIVPDPVYEYVMTSDTNFMNINITVTGKYKIYICAGPMPVV